MSRSRAMSRHRARVAGMYSDDESGVSTTELDDLIFGAIAEMNDETPAPAPARVVAAPKKRGFWARLFGWGR